MSIARHEPAVSYDSNEEWVVYCSACTYDKGEWVPVCLLGPDRWPPPRLTRSAAQVWADAVHRIAVVRADLEFLAAEWAAWDDDADPVLRSWDGKVLQGVLQRALTREGPATPARPYLGAQS